MTDIEMFLKVLSSSLNETYIKNDMRNLAHDAAYMYVNFPERRISFLFDKDGKFDKIAKSE